MRFRILGLIMAILLSMPTKAQSYGLEVETVSENIGLLVGALGPVDLTGYACYRAYITMENEDDFLSSISGDATNPTYVNTTTDFYQAALGAATPNGINSVLFAVYPDLAYDSWVTIGLEQVPNAQAGEATVATVSSEANPWSTTFDPGFGMPGGNITIDDVIGGAWYALNGDANGVAGSDLRVLAGQFTTTGDLSLQFYTQIFINGDGQNEVPGANGAQRPTYTFPAAGEPGCTNAGACNYNAEATEDDGSCEFSSCVGCTDVFACNYDDTATIADNDECEFPDFGFNCDGSCIEDADQDGICDPFEVPGCTDDAYLEYNPLATDDDGSCTTLIVEGCTDEEYLEYNPNANVDDGSCLTELSFGCTDPGACNYNSNANTDNGSCEYTTCTGCTDATACNYDGSATIDNGSCDFTSCAGCTDDLACNYDPTATIDNGSCESESCAGCTDAAACNYDPAATLDNGSCDFNCFGCTDAAACNYDATATVDDGSCESESCAGCTDAAACNYDDTATIDDGSCESDSCAGCTDAAACNYDDTATIDDGSCDFAEPNLDCNGECLNDINENGVCDEEENFGCTDSMACNYDADADADNGSCEYPSDVCDGATNVNCDCSCVNDADQDGICDEDEVPGCTDSSACNFDPEATDNDGSCESESCAGCTDSMACNYDNAATIDDGSCEFESCAGCTDATACNYDDSATIDDASCTYPAADNLDCNGACINDADIDGICDEDEIGGCQDPEALNFDEGATDDDGSCEYPCTPEWGVPTIYPNVATVLAMVTVDGANADMMDVVGAFVNGELRGEGNMIEFEGATFINMSVYLAQETEMVDFIFFNQDECSTCTMDADLTAMSFGDYGSFADPLLLDAACSEVTLEVSVDAGWNYVSTNVMPANYAISSLFEDALDGSLLKVLGDDDFALGSSYTPGIPSVFNSLQTHTDAAGYVIKMTEGGVWSSTGTPLDAASTPLDLNEGWNIIGYVPQAAMSVEEATATIDGLVGTVIDGQNGTVWNPTNPVQFNSLLNLEPGRSYWLRMLEGGTLTYPSTGGIEGSGMAIAGLRSSGEAAQTMTGWEVARAPMAAAVAAEIRLDDAAVEGEAYVGAFVGESCVAARPVIQWNDATAAQMAILLNEESEVTFKLWVDGVVYGSSDVMFLAGGEERGQGGDVLPILRFGSQTQAITNTEWVTGLEISPMPTRNETWMDLTMDRSGQVRIAVLDARGAEVAVLHDGEMTAGEHRLQFNASRWAAGTYFIKGTSTSGVFRTPLIVQ